MDYKSTLMWKEILELPEVLRKIMPGNTAAMAKIRAELARCGVKNFICAGRGTSDHALVYFKYISEIFTKFTVGLAGCSALTAYAGRADFDGSAVVGVSQSGQAADVLAVLVRAKEQGAFTVAITNDPESPMAKVADVSLNCCCGPEKSVAATKTFLAQCFLLLWLAAESGEVKEILGRLPGFGGELAAKVSEADRVSRALVSDFGGVRDGFVLSRGITFALASEAGLKLQETCYLKMRSYSESDFQHGPMAMISGGTPVLFFLRRASALRARSSKRGTRRNFAPCSNGSFPAAQG